jgi:hypothetical protein
MSLTVSERGSPGRIGQLSESRQPVALWKNSDRAMAVE